MKINVNKILSILAEREMTRSEAAIACGLCRPNMSTVLTRGTCSERTAGKLAKGLGVDVAEIMEEVKQ